MKPLQKNVLYLRDKKRFEQFSTFNIFPSFSIEKKNSHFVFNNSNTVYKNKSSSLLPIRACLVTCATASYDFFFIYIVRFFSCAYVKRKSVRKREREKVRRLGPPKQLFASNEKRCLFVTRAKYIYTYFIDCINVCARYFCNRCGFLLWYQYVVSFPFEHRVSHLDLETVFCSQHFYV